MENEPDLDCQVLENADRQGQRGLKRKGEDVELRTPKKSKQTRNISKVREIASHLKIINSPEGSGEKNKQGQVSN